MIRQAPNLLLLDEPTNHLDLEMRQALSVALIEYSGALVVISHDRHLLRSVCDDLLIVHDGIVDRFDRSLDDYPAWLREQEEKTEQVEAKWNDEPAKTVNKRQQRQEQAEQRQRLKPLRDKVKAVERELESKRSRLIEVEAQLVDESIYSDPNRKDELTRLIREQAAVKSSIEELEGEWLDASEALEQAT
jgi:ATP-binding cassette subfamily F protein 3